MTLTSAPCLSPLCAFAEKAQKEAQEVVKKASLEAQEILKNLNDKAALKPHEIQDSLF